MALQAIQANSCMRSLVHAMPNEQTVASSPASNSDAGSAIDCQYCPASSSAVQLLARLSRSATPNAQLIESAIRKMAMVQPESLYSVESIACLVMAQQLRQTNERVRQGTADIKQRFERIMDKNRKRLKAIHDRIRARKNDSRWGFLSKVFKAVAAACSAASSVVTGPVGAAGAALLAGSLVVSMTVKNDAGQWISLGLSLAALALSLGSSVWGQGLEKGTEVATQKALDTLSSCNSSMSSVCEVGQGFAQRDAMMAEAALIEIKAITKKLLSDQQQERDEMETIIKVKDRCMKQVMKILEIDHAMKMASIRV